NMISEPKPTIKPIIAKYTIIGSKRASDTRDKKLGINTIPNKYGLKFAAIISVILYSIIIVMDPLPFFIFIDSCLYFDLLFLILILIPVISYVFLSLSLLKNQSKENTLKLRKLIFVIMQIGTLAYLVGVLI
ncbi:unnamed protein product, partial [marine sediment metagenome]